MTDLELKMHMRQALDRSMPPLPDDPRLTDKVLSLYEEKWQIRRQRMIGLRVAVALAVIVLIVCGGLFTKDLWYVVDGTVPDDDYQWHTFETYIVTTPINGTAQADFVYQGEDIFLQTTDWNEVVSALGITPRMPTWLPDGWEPSYYVVIVNDCLCEVVACYKHPDYRYSASFDLTIHYSMEGLGISLSEEEPGSYTKLENGISVYVTKSDGGSTFWFDGMTTCALYIPTNEEDALHMIYSIYGLDWPE